MQSHVYKENMCFSIMLLQYQPSFYNGIQLMNNILQNARPIELLVNTIFRVPANSNKVHNFTDRLVVTISECFLLDIK